MVMTKNPGPCMEGAVTENWPLVEVCLQINENIG